MKASFYKLQIDSLLSMVENNCGHQADQTSVLALTDFTDVQMLESEKQMFANLPLIIGHSSELSKPGDFIVRELDQKSWLLVRGKDNQVRAFYNYCQHRGTKLVHETQGCKKRFSCPYHAWTYDTHGDLVGVPRIDLFPDLDKSKKGLRQGHLEEAFGFYWLTQNPSKAQAVSAYLGGLVPELEALNLGEHKLYFDKTRDLNANWKLPIYAFLESYHIGTLHKDSIAEFFIENVAYSERHGPHIRSFVPRLNAPELAELDLETTNLSDYITPTNILFPNVCMIGHPTSYSIISMFPGEKPGTATWRHMLLVPERPNTEAEKAHFDKTVAVLDGVTYEKEDFWASEQIQEGIDAGALDELLLSKNESLLKEYGDTIKDYLLSNT